MSWRNSRRVPWFRPQQVLEQSVPRNCFAADDLETVNSRLNVATNGIRATGNINIKTSKKTNLVVGARFNQGYGRNSSFSNSLMNWKNNGAYQQP